MNWFLCEAIFTNTTIASLLCVCVCVCGSFLMILTHPSLPLPSLQLSLTQFPVPAEPCCDPTAMKHYPPHQSSTLPLEMYWPPLPSCPLLLCPFYFFSTLFSTVPFTLSRCPFHCFSHSDQSRFECKVFENPFYQSIWANNLEKSERGEGKKRKEKKKRFRFIYKLYIR